MFGNFGQASKYTCEHPILLRSVHLGVSPSKEKHVSLRRVMPDYLKDSFKSEDGEIVYRPRFSSKVKDKEVWNDGVSVPLLVRCGKCAHCQKFNNDMWFVRCCHHFLCNKHKEVFPLFVTFTFSPKWFSWLCSKLIDLPEDGKVDYRPIYNYVFVNMKKRLRADRGEGLCFDYLAVSEFGEKKGRFHFHCIFYFYLDRSFYDRMTLWLKQKNFTNDGKEFVNGDMCRHFIVNKRDKSRRLQSDEEVFLQSILEKHFSEVFGKRVRDHVPHARLASNGHYSVYYNGQLGYVTAFSGSNLGLFHYIVSYSLKCFKDGVSTFRRMSPGIGYEWASKHQTEIFDGLFDLVPVGKNQDGVSYKYPLPRAYHRWYGDRFRALDHVLSVCVPEAVSYIYRTFDQTSKEVEFEGQIINIPINKNQLFYVQN